MPAVEYIDDCDKFPPNMQIDAEEEIAQMIFAKSEEAGNARLDEDDCQELGQAILLRVLTVFRPDLVQEAA